MSYSSLLGTYVGSGLFASRPVAATIAATIPPGWIGFWVATDTGALYSIANGDSAWTAQTGASAAVTTSLSSAISTVDSTQSTSLSKISSSLSTTNSTAVKASTSLSQVSSSLSGAISSTSSLSTAVSTVISGSISTVTSSVASLSTAVGTGGGHAYEGFGDLQSIAALTKLVGASANITLTNGTPGSVYSWTASAANALQLADEAVPATPWDYYLRFTSHSLFSSDVQFGITLRNSANGHILVFTYNSDANFNVQEWTSPTAFSSTIISLSTGNCFLKPIWLRIHSDGTTLTFYYGSDGVNWTQLTTRTIATFMGAITHAGIGGVPEAAGSCGVYDFGNTAPA